MIVSGGIRIDIAASDGFTVNLSKYTHVYGVLANGTLKDLLSTGIIKVSVKNGNTELTCADTSTSAPTIDGTYKVTSITVGAGMTITKTITSNQFTFYPATFTIATPLTVTLTIVAMWEGKLYTFTQEVTYSKTSDGDVGQDGASGVNYIPMGFWDITTDYYLSDIGIPFVKRADGSTLGYSVFALNVAHATKGTWIVSEWRLVDSVEFIYMQNAYIEHLQALMVTAKILRTSADGARTEIDPNGIRVFNALNNMNIRFGLKDGYAVMEYYDNYGKFLYDLGPNGISKIETRDMKWTEVKYISMGTDPSVIVTTPSIKTKYKQSWLQTETTYYHYTSKIDITGNTDEMNDGKVFISQSLLSGTIPNGYYMAKVMAGWNAQYKSMDSGARIYPADMNVNNEAVYDTPPINVATMWNYSNGRTTSSLGAYWNG